METGKQLFSRFRAGKWKKQILGDRVHLIAVLVMVTVLPVRKVLKELRFIVIASVDQLCL